MPEGTTVYLCSIYDQDPAKVTKRPFTPDYENFELEADGDQEALSFAEDELSIAARVCHPAEGYSVGDKLWLTLRRGDGSSIGTITHTLTKDDLYEFPS